MTNGKDKPLFSVSPQLNLPLLQQALQQVELLKRENEELKAEITKLNRQITTLRVVAESGLKYKAYDPASGDFSPRSELPEEEPVAVSSPLLPVRHTPLNFGQDNSPASASRLVFASETLTPNEKIVLFRGLFVGRQDVYAVRWQSGSTGKSGYQPARNHDYSSHKYDPAKKKRICGNNCLDLPLTDEVLKHHLQGKHTIGTYPLLQDDTCPFLCIDLDEEGWQDDAQSLLQSAELLGVPAYLERSRSGDGGHFWIFFQRPVQAATARRLGDALITKSNQGQQPLGLRSYDRMFPNQDTMPTLGYGNLIALPLQKDPLSRGNSAFLDQSMTPYADQWGLLRSIQRISASAVDRIVGEATRRDALMSVARPSEDEDTTNNTDPWSLPPSGRSQRDTLLQAPFPETFKITLGNLVYIEKEGLSKSHLSRLTRLAAFQNPQFFANQALRLSTYSTPRIICCAEDFTKHLGLPRGCLDELTELLENSGAPYVTEDQRFIGKKIKAKFTGKLRQDQLTAARELLENDTGVLAAATGIGKTVVAAYCIAKRKTNTLVLVHRRQLLEQWTNQLTTFLDVPPVSIGQIGGGKNRPTGKIELLPFKAST